MKDSDKMTTKEAKDALLFHFQTKKLCGESLDFDKLGPFEQAVLVIYRDWNKLKTEKG